MAYTLISFVGTGMYKDDGYDSAKYIFPNNQEIETPIFIKALLKNKYRNFSKIILLGTITSGWDLFLENDIDFWTEIKEKRENSKLTMEDFHKIQLYIERELEIPVVIKYHTDKIDSDTSIEIFNTYNSIIPEITDENILFDITHSFRSMPILLYQALQFSISQNSNIKNVELVYGELKGKGKPAYVRDLSQYWRYSQISDALNLFVEKLQGNRLSELLQYDWPDGAKVIKRFSEIVASNFSLQLIEVLRNINNVLKKVPDNLPSYWDKIIEFLNSLCKINEDKTDSKTLFDFSVFFYNKKLYIQSIITMQESVEMAIGEYHNCKDKVGDYDWWQETGKNLLKQEKGKDQKMKKELENLEYFRNQIAHGGGKSKHMKGFPQISNINDIYDSGKEGVEKLLKMLNL